MVIIGLRPPSRKDGQSHMAPLPPPSGGTKFVLPGEVRRDNCVAMRQGGSREGDDDDLPGVFGLEVFARLLPT